jgi:branched-chain amino acid transport system permease protein
VTTLVNIVVGGIVHASILFLVSVGLTLVFGVMRILNIAHGSLYALGAYLGAWGGQQLTQLGVPGWFSYPLLIIAGIAVGAIAGPIVERVFLRRMYGREEAIVLIVTFAVFLMLEDAIKLIWGVFPLRFSQPARLLGFTTLSGVSYPNYYFLVVVVAILTGLGLHYALTRTQYGKAVVAVTADREMSQAMGINVSRVFIVAFSFGAALAAIGGAVNAPLISVAPGLSVGVIVIAFAVVVIGGLGSMAGAAIGALLIGFTRVAAIQFFPEVELLTIYLIMTLVLIVRPRGLFGEPEVRRI